MHPVFGAIMACQKWIKRCSAILCNLVFNSLPLIPKTEMASQSNPVAEEIIANFASSYVVLCEKWDVHNYDWVVANTESQAIIAQLLWLVSKF